MFKFPIPLSSNLTFLLCLGSVVVPSVAQEVLVKKQDIVIEIFIRPDSKQCELAKEFLGKMAVRRPGIQIKSHDVTKDKEQLARIWKITRQHGREKAMLPTIYACDRLFVGFRDAATTGAAIENLFTIKAFTRTGCAKCRDAKEYLAELKAQWPALKIEIYDTPTDPIAHKEMVELARQRGLKVVSVPCFYTAGRFIVGFQGKEITGRQLEDIFRDRSSAPDKKKETETKQGSNETSHGQISNEEVRFKQLVLKSAGDISSKLLTQQFNIYNPMSASIVDCSAPFFFRESIRI